ncbi:hypothetical protein CQZ98_23630 [Pseudomonas sp. MYb115]|nr:hypothetical protein CQZ98_23630 [Pseudomonas sp. MYb115]QXN52419.1 hypothetical protein KW062_12065 [Pseudomonas fluorescens]
MTMETSWLSLLLLAGPFFLFTFKILFNLYLIRRHLDSMISALPNSRYMYIWGKTLRKQGWFGGMLLINKIAGMIMFPTSYIRLGDFDRDDVSNFPPHLKRLLKIEITMLMVSAAWMLAISY